VRKCSCGFILGACLCGVSLGSAETFEFNRPSQPMCTARYFVYDFGPPAGCDNDSMPHSRMGWVTSVAASTTSLPIVAFMAHDAEDAAEPPGPGFEVTFFDPTRLKDGGSSST
jgi:hypothetical protein